MHSSDVLAGVAVISCSLLHARVGTGGATPTRRPFGLTGDGFSSTAAPPACSMLLYTCGGAQRRVSSAARPPGRVGLVVGWRDGVGR